MGCISLFFEPYLSSPLKGRLRGVTQKIPKFIKKKVENNPLRTNNADTLLSFVFNSIGKSI
jgi:hypothetical protein